MSLYLWVKYLHLLSAITMVGTSNANGFMRLFANRQPSLWLVASASRLIMKLNWTLMMPSLVILPATGLYLALTAVLPLWAGWVLLGELGTLVLWVLFVVGVVLEGRMERANCAAFERQETEIPEAYHRADRWGLIVGLSATSAELAVLFLMVFRELS